MDYYLNEYSLRGQFDNTDGFFESLRSYTLPVLKKVRENKENVIWKRQEFWNSKICKGITISNIPVKKNERSGELMLFKIQLSQLAKEEPFLEDSGESDLYIKEYQFDEEYRCNFEETNCFTKAIENEGRIISFKPPSYESAQLAVIVNCEEEEKTCNIDNIYQISWWKNEPKIETWKVVKRHFKWYSDCAVSANKNLHIEVITITACGKKQHAFFLTVAEKSV